MNLNLGKSYRCKPNFRWMPSRYVPVLRSTVRRKIGACEGLLCLLGHIAKKHYQLYKISKPQALYYPKLWSTAILISTGILYIMYELPQTLSTWKNQEQWNHFHVLQIIASAEGSLYFNKTFSEIHHRHSFIQMEYTMRLFQLYSLHTTSSRKEACCYTVALASLHLQCWSSLPAGSHQPPQSVISVAIGIQHV